ncbi:hypothetical protein ACWCOT_17395 [Nonomuraea bangladeshensis]
MLTQVLEILKELVGELSKAVKNARAWVKVLLAAALSCALVGAGVVWGIKLAGPPDTALGGVDLASSCIALNYETNDQQFCSSRIDLKAACNWQYSRTDLAFRFTSASAESGVCYAPGKRPLGGIADMRGYCKYAFRPSISVDAANVNNIWTCREKIDMNLACQLRYRRYEGVEARNEDGVWQCYQVA